MANILERLVKYYDYDVTMIAGLVEKTFQEKYEKSFEILDLRIFDYGRMPHQQPINLGKFLLKARNVISKYNVDAFHFNSHTPNLIPYFIFSKKPKICTIHHLEDFTALSGFFPKVFLPITQDFFEVNTPCSIIHVPSKHTKKEVVKRRLLARRRIVVIPNGIDLSNYLPIKKKLEPGLFLMIGRLEPKKHYDQALLAAKLAKKYRKDFRLYIIGEGSLRPYLESKIRLEHLEETIKLLGNLDEQEKIKLLSRAEALIHLGYPEGFGLVIIEALATGTPVISYNLPPINEIIKNNVHGILVSKDDIASLARALIHFRAENFNPDVLRAKAAEYDLEQTARKFHKLYSALLNKFTRA
jgi:glycosyltransferase involved in cell wall biosynthesis